MSAIQSWCDEAVALVATDAGLGLSEASSSVMGDWRLVWASSDDALSVVGSGLHKVPLTLMEDLFLSFQTPSTKGGRPEVRLKMGWQTRHHAIENCPVSDLVCSQLKSLFTILLCACLWCFWADVF